MMYHALDLGISVRDFWQMSPRAVLLIQSELVAARDAHAGERSTGPARRLRLADLPKP